MFIDMWKVGRLAIRRLPVWSAQARNFESVAGINREWFLERRTPNIHKEIGVKKLKQARQELGRAVSDATNKASTNDNELMDLYNASEKLYMTDSMTSLFRTMMARGTPIMAAMYDSYFRSLYDHKKSSEMLRVYDHLKQFGSSDTLEVTYRFQIVALLMQGKMDEAYATYEEAVGILFDRPTEIESYMMLYAVEEDRLDIAKQLFEAANLQMGIWHASTIGRVLLAMEKAGEPDRAFTFYKRSGIQPSGSTLKGLLRICRANNWKARARAVLKNCQRSELEIETKEYNVVLEALDFIGQRDQIRVELADMKARKVPFNRTTHHVVYRNQDILPDELLSVKSLEIGQEEEEKLIAMKSNELNKHLRANDLDGAISTLQEYSAYRSPRMRQTNGGLSIVPHLATSLIEGLHQAGRHDQVADLVPMFVDEPSKFGPVLSLVENLYGEMFEYDDMVAQVTKGMMSNDDVTFNGTLAVRRFKRLRDVDGLYALYAYAIKSLKNLGFNKGRKKPETHLHKYIGGHNIHIAFKALLKEKARRGELEEALSMIEEMQSIGWNMRKSNYDCVATGMQSAFQKNSKTYRPEDAVKVLEHMQGKGLDATIKMVAMLSSLLETGDKEHKMLLLEKYEEARKSGFDAREFHYYLYTPLVRCAAILCNPLERLRMLQADILISDPEPSSWSGKSAFVSELLVAYASKDAFDDAKKLYQDHIDQKSYTAKALLKLFEIAVARGDIPFVNQVMERIKRDNLFFQLDYAYQFVHQIKYRKSARLMMDILDRFEAGNVVKGTNKLIDAYGPEHPTNWVQVISMYATVLKDVEKSGDWKKVLQLRKRIKELLGVNVFKELMRVKKELFELDQQMKE